MSRFVAVLIASSGLARSARSSQIFIARRRRSVAASHGVIPWGDTVVVCNTARMGTSNNNRRARSNVIVSRKQTKVMHVDANDLDSVLGRNKCPRRPCVCVCVCERSLRCLFQVEPLGLSGQAVVRVRGRVARWHCVCVDLAAHRAEPSRLDDVALYFFKHRQFGCCSSRGCRPLLSPNARRRDASAQSWQAELLAPL